MSTLVSTALEGLKAASQYILNNLHWPLTVPLHMLVQCVFTDSSITTFDEFRLICICKVPDVYRLMSTVQILW